MKVLVTGSSGLIGSEAVEHFDREGHEVFGVDNNMRRVFFGAAGDTLWNLERLKNTAKRFTHAAIDIRDRSAIEELFSAQRFDLIVHCAAQPSHDKARDIPLLDFDVIDETCRIDRTLHSLFGASKAAADLVAQEYGRYFNMKVGVFRGGCLTGPSHSG